MCSVLKEACPLINTPEKRWRRIHG